MRNVKRTSRPDSLKRNFDIWTKELLQDIKQGKSPNYRYNQRDIKKQLKEMYSSLCCYCESNTETTGFGHIEHRLPKKHFPEKTYDWDNLHWSCQRCDNSKRDWFDKENPILDAVNDNIPTNLSYKYVLRMGLTKRGINTIERTTLNRRELQMERKKLVDKIGDIVKILKEGNITKKHKQVAFNTLESMKNDEYGSFVSHVLQYEKELL